MGQAAETSVLGRTITWGSLALLSLFVLLAIAPKALAAPSHPELSSPSLENVGWPRGVATDSEGNLYVSNTALFVGTPTVKIFSPTGSLITEFNPSNTAFPAGLAVDSAGNVYVASIVTFGEDPSDVVKYNPSSFPPTGSTTYSADASINGNGRLVSGRATGVAVDPSDQSVLVAEAGVNEKQIFDRPTSDDCSAAPAATEYTLTFRGATTIGLNCDGTSTESDPSAASIEAALNALSTIGGAGGSVTVLGGEIKNIEFKGELGNQNIEDEAIIVNKKVSPSEEVELRKSTTMNEGIPGRVSKFQPDGTLVSDTIGAGVVAASYYGVDVYGANGNVYVTDLAHSKAYILNPAGSAVLAEIAGPPGGFGALTTSYLAVDQSNGNVLVSDIRDHGTVSEFNSGGKFLTNLSHTPALEESGPSDIAVDNSGGSGGPGEGEEGRVYVTSGTFFEGSVFSYGPLAPQFPLTVSATGGSGSGSVECDLGAGAETCLPEYAETEEVTLVPEADPGSEFKEWTGACTGSGPCVVTMSSAQSVNAVFDIAGFALTVTKSGDGTGKVESTPPGIDCGGDCAQTYAENTVVTLTPTADPGSEFKEWTGACTGSGACEVTMDAAKTVDAQFDALVGFSELGVTKSGNGSGAVASSPPGISCGADCSELFADNTVVTLTPTADSGSEFKEWTGACTGSEACEVTMGPAKAVDAKFELQAPTVTDVDPDAGPTAGGTSVKITGTNLTGATSVKFGGTEATSFTVNGATEITATAPAGSVGPVDVRVTTPGGESANTSADDYTYVAAPAIASVNPNAGPTAGGTPVTITGTNLTGAASVKFGATPATGFTVNSDTQITATAPAGSAGTVDVRVTTPGGESANTAADDYRYADLPTVTNVNPNAGPTAGGTSLTITGTNLTGASAVKFGAIAATGVTVVSDTQITATAPAGSAGTVDVRVTTPGGESANTAADDYRYADLPTVTNVNPNAGPTAGGTSLTITGTNLTGASAVKFGATPGTGVTVVSPTQITAIAPPGSPGTVDIAVTAPGGESANTPADDYTYVAAPAIIKVDPSAGPTAGGTSVTITGTNLTGASAVKFGATAATGFTVNGATQITATAPAGSAVTVDVRVTTTGGESATGASAKYTYTAAPSVVTSAGATGISQTGASVAGTVNPNSGNVTACKVEYGATTSYGTQVDCASLPGSGSNAVNVSAGLTGLSAETVYHFRVAATNAGGTTNGSDQTFTTLADTCATKASLCPPSTPSAPAPVEPSCANTPSLCPPSSDATLGAAKPQGSNIALKVTVPGPGSLVATGKNLAKVKANAKAAGPVTLKLKLTNAGKKQLKSKGKVKVKVKVVFTPTGGSPGTTTKTVTFKAAGKK